MTATCRPTLALAATALALALVPLASASHVAPDVVEGPDNHTCSDFAPEGVSWLELKVDPADSGTFTSADGILVVTLLVDDATKTFSWTANMPIVGVVFVKAGDAGHHMYAYNPPEAADDNLTSPGDGETNQISHISFCYVVSEVPDCESNPEMPECQVTCEDDPTMPECQPTCEDDPTMPECPTTCEDDPTMPECPPTCGEPGMPPCVVPCTENPHQAHCPPVHTCEDMPEMPECQEDVDCPAGIVAVANGDGSITLTITFAGDFDLYRMAEGGTPELMGSFSGDTVVEDTMTEVGTTYTYTVVVGPAQCGMVEVTAIPVFPTAVGAVAAVGLGAVGYAFARRRK